MPKYKISTTKNQKKYIFVLNANSQNEAKKNLHKKGYSILNIELFDDAKINDNVYFFKGIKNGEIKKGKVVGKDILKNYIRLVDELKYDIIEFYSIKDKNKTDKQKKVLLEELQNQYKIYKKHTKTKKEVKKENNNINGEIKIDSFYLKNKLEETHKLINYILEKTKSVFENRTLNLAQEKKEKLKELYNSLIKIKSSTNISKLKKIGEAVLIKIGEIELKALKELKNKETEKYLKETNNLLKKIGSKEKFINPNKNYGKKISNFIKELKSSFKDSKEKSSKKEDYLMYEYYKTQYLINQYKLKLKENTKKIIKNFYVFFIPTKSFNNKKNELLVRREVIKQNLLLLKAKLKNNKFSYTKIKKGIKGVFENIFNLFISIRDYLFIIVIIYSLIFLLIININFFGYGNFHNFVNYRGIFYFIMFIFIYFAIYFSRGLKTLFLNIFLLLFIFLFGIINF